jgi:hypothetical protein
LDTQEKAKILIMCNHSYTMCFVCRKGGIKLGDYESRVSVGLNSANGWSTLRNGWIEVKGEHKTGAI